VALEENVGAAAANLTPDDIGEIDSAVSGITEQGARYQRHPQQLVGAERVRRLARSCAPAANAASGMIAGCSQQTLNW